MKSFSVFRWFQLNLVCFAPFFFLTAIFAIFFPDAALRVLGKWVVLLQAAGDKNVGDFASQSEMFTHILARNSITVVVYLVIGLLLQSPLVMLFTGAFYALIAFLAPHTIGKPLGVNDWFLISAELFVLMLSISLSSALAGDLFDVRPDAKSLWGCWKHNWYKLLPKPVSHWKLVLREWLGTVVVVVSVIFVLLVLVAWFEVYGY